MKTYILERLKENLGSGEEDEEQGFPDMNYQVGNTSGLDVGNIPTPIARRIGSQAQIGGGLMEVQIYNPSTFYMHSDDIISVIDQLGLDITLHSDPNIGFSSAYKTRGQQGAGVETVHPYFTQYLDALADFKQEVELKGENGEPPFDIGRINPHISTSPMPALEERMAADVGLDPFGFTMTDLEDQNYHKRSEEGRNIYENKPFMRKFYKTFVVDEIGNNEYQYFGNFYTSFSTSFDISWREAQNEIAKKIWNDRTGKNGNARTEDKMKVLSIAGTRDPAVSPEWLDILEDHDFEEVELDIQGNLQRPINNEISSLDELDTFLKAISQQRYGLSQMRNLPELYYFMKKEQMERMVSQTVGINSIGNQKELWEKVEPELNKAMDKLWKREDEEDEVKVSLISVETKVAALSRELEIPENRIPERAFEDHKADLREDIADMFAGEEQLFKDPGDEEGSEDSEGRHLRFLQAFTRQFEQQMWMESNLFYYIMPCWMSSSKYHSEEHEGWRAPEFIWKAIVKDRWEDDYHIDLENPDPEDEKGYFDALEESEEFRRDVCAATAACYVWGHFTQMDSEFDSGNETWMEFMNRHGIGVNLEAMEGNTQQVLKLWRPKDVAVAAHAINITAREELGEINDELDDCIAKFTIDMEHVAAAGVDPWQEMLMMKESEERIGKYEDYSLGINPEKPLAKILRQYHLMKPGVESQQGTRHGPFSRGDKQIYTWLYRLVEAGFARNEEEPAAIMYEQGEEKDETIYTTRIAMNLIELGVDPEEVTVDNVDLERAERNDYRDEKEALIARFFGIDKANYSREWAKIEEHAFDPLEGLLEAEQFDYTYSSKASIESDNNPQDWMGEEYQ